MAGQPDEARQDGTPIAEAAALLGLSQEATRKRLQRGTLAGYKLGDHWYVLLDRQDNMAGRQDTRQDTWQDDGRTDRQDVAGQRRDAEPIEAAYRVAGEAAAEVALVPLATMVAELRGLAAQLADLARRNEGLALEVGTLRERVGGRDRELTMKDQALAAHALTIAELRRRAEAAEAERDALRAVQAAPPPRSDEEAPRVGEDTPKASAGRWGRLGRWWRGGGGG